jgi:prepilin-type N-terminal cleavage/methylation domain-containing protein
MKKAFTLLELVFVIVVIGILAALILPRTKTNPVQEAAIQVLSHIRYTQHLALVDDKYDSSDVNWSQKRWQILFSDNHLGADDKWAYTIFADTVGASTGNPNESEIAVNPQNPNQRMTGGQTASNSLKIDDSTFVGMNKLNLGRSYGITNVTFSPSCSVHNSTRLAFDYLGRPLKGSLADIVSPYDNIHLIQRDCNITITDGTETAIIQISPETGYAKVIF